MASFEEVVRGRRSIGKVKSDPIPKELVEKLIDAAIWAPNHFRTEPWRFIVMTGEGRKVLGNAYVDIASEKWDEVSNEEREQRSEKEVAKAFRSPVVIAAVCAPSDDPRADLREELAASHAAVQNLLLSAHANGLGAVWRTGDPTYHPKMKQAFGLGEREQIVGFVYVGYPDMQQPEGTRTPGAEKTVWIEN
ncbi:nitroreductase family protein [Cohnella terricola]|uniref:Putative NAD(P)H nitroreductase n=1 Tax=Cohnella terricola TaxID=1289167 RepID=A0A559JWY7_9BACL|nr:nitroreductase [Cohnella terricola]TVY04401.1 nitroreductase [Cohnella terricola]